MLALNPKPFAFSLTNCQEIQIAFNHQLLQSEKSQISTIKHPIVLGKLSVFVNIQLAVFDEVATGELIQNLVDFS